MSEETIEKLFTVLPKLERHLLREVITHRSPTKSSSSQTQKSIILDGTLEQIMQMLAKKSTDICFQIFKAVFVDLSTDKAKQSIENNPNFKANHTFTYGDIEFSSFVNILQRCEPRKGDIFVDLGHGTGRALVAASIMYGTTLSKIRGIELLTELVELSKQKVDLYNKLMDSSPYNEMFAPNVSSNNTRGGMEGETGCAEELRCDISIEEGDFLVDSMNSADSDTFDWTTADIVFANSTCFGVELMKQLAEKAEKLQPGSKMITLTHRLPSACFELLDQRQYCMSWGAATCFIQRRL